METRKVKPQQRPWIFCIVPCQGKIETSREIAMVYLRFLSAHRTLPHLPFRKHAFKHHVELS